MTQRIDTALLKRLAKAAPPERETEVADSELTGFVLKHLPHSGGIRFYAVVRRARRETIAHAQGSGRRAVNREGEGELWPVDARDVLDRKKPDISISWVRKECRRLQGEAIGGKDHAAKRQAEKSIPTLREYIEGQYGDWARSKFKTGRVLIGRIAACFFSDFGDKPLDQINAWVVEKWRAARIKKGIKAATINRDLGSFKAALARAVEWEIIATNPLAKVKPLKMDSRPSVRYLEPEEERGLRAALEAREGRLRRDRGNANRWREQRSYELLPSMDSAYADHLTPMVLLSMNTGMRRGELFGLKWADVDLDRCILTIQGYGAKSGKTRHLPLNSEAAEVLKGWKAQQDDTGLVFKSRDGGRFNNVKKAWANLLKDARITNFRWHDMRHHFASELVMAGVDLNTVRDLLGHSDILMTLRYAHLAPEHKAAAVEKLVTNRATVEALAGS